MSGEYIDGPAPETDLSREELATLIFEHLIEYSYARARDFEHNEELDQEPFRLVSLVETNGSKLGYGLGLSGKLEFTNDGEIPVQSIFFAVDRETHSIVEEPKTIDLMISRDAAKIDEQIAIIATDFDTDELEKILALLNKAAKIYSEDLASTELMDADVRRALIEGYLGELAARFPSARNPSSEISTDTEHPCESSEFRLALEQCIDRLKTANDKDRHGDMVNLLHTVDSQSYMLSILYGPGLQVSYVTLLIVGNPTLVSGYANPDQAIDVDSLEKTTEDNFKDLPSTDLLVEILKSGKSISESLFEAHYEDAIKDLEDAAAEECKWPDRF